MLRLKEKPSEWQKFVAVMGATPTLIVWLAWGRGKLSLHLPVLVTAVVLAVLVVSLIRPRWFRGFYRMGMTISYRIGLVFGKGLLFLFFLFLVTPLGWLLRLAGKDLLHMKRTSAEPTWWREARDNRDFDRMF